MQLAALGFTITSQPPPILPLNAASKSGIALAAIANRQIESIHKKAIKIIPLAFERFVFQRLFGSSLADNRSFQSAGLPISFNRLASYFNLPNAGLGYNVSWP